MGPTRRCDERNPVWRVFERLDGGRAHFHATLGGRTGRIVLLLILHRPAPVADNLASVAVDQERNDRVVEALPVIVQVQQGVYNRMAQPALLVQGLVGVGHVDALLDQAGHQSLGSGMAPVIERSVRRFAPDVVLGAAIPVLHRLAFDIVVCQDAEGGDNVFFEVLVLVIPPDHHEVRVKGVQLGTLSAEAVD